MPGFRYEDYSNPWAPRIAEQMQRGPQAQADAALRIGDIQARAAEQRGAAWANGIAGAGQAVAGAIQQAYDPRRKLEAQQLEAGGLQLAEQKRAIAMRSALSQAITSTPMSDEGGVSVYDIPAITKNLPPEFRANADEVVKHLGGINEAFRAEQAAKLTVVQRGATSLLAGGADPDMTLHFIDTIEKNGTYPKQQLDQFRSFIQANPDKTELVLRQFIPQQKDEILPEGATAIDPITKQVTAHGAPKPPTAAELAVRAAQGDPEAAAAMDRLKPKPNATAEQDDQRYRDIQARASQQQPVTAMEQAWANAYEKQKTLGVDKSAGAAADRQATAISAQTAQQKRSQDFNEAQAGRHELTEKVEQPYRTAVASANTLRDVVASARAGNRVAASLQALETTFSAVRAQGLNRVNMSEIGLPASAGSAWDRLAGWWDKKKEGQPVPPNIQQDMIDFAGILERAAHKRYSEGFADVTKRYGLKDEKPIAGPVADGTPGLLANGTHEVIQNGVRYKVTTDASGKVISSEKVKR